jgi:purine-nucleoside phosphorylase
MHQPSLIAETAATLQIRCGTAPAVAVVLGSGWASAAQHVQDARHVDYSDLPAFQSTSVEGHVSALTVGRMGLQRVAMLRGRPHLRKRRLHRHGRADPQPQGLGRAGHRADQCQRLLAPHQPPGSLMLISDHINAPQRSPLVGLTGMDRFCDMSGRLRRRAAQDRAGARPRAGRALHEGTYCWALGPQFETPAEIRMFPPGAPTPWA